MSCAPKGGFFTTSALCIRTAAVYTGCGMSELPFIQWLKSQVKPRPDIPVNIGDDASVVTLKETTCLLKVDSVVEGVHFESNARAEQIGHKALGRALSDIAAMGCTARFALVAYVLSPDTTLAKAKAIFKGIKTLAEKFGVAIVGGDVAAHSGPLVVSVSALGETAGLTPVRRDGAKEGDAICVTGDLGGSILGKHLTFVPRLELAADLNRRFKIHSMIDISDGFIRDLAHICEASGVGAAVFQDQMPVSDAARKLSEQDKRSPLYHALYDGEDYELIFTCDPEEASKIAGEIEDVSIIGEIVSKKGVTLRTTNGKDKKLPIRGWEYQLKHV